LRKTKTTTPVIETYNQTGNVQLAIRQKRKPMKVIAEAIVLTDELRGNPQVLSA